MASSHMVETAVGEGREHFQCERATTEAGRLVWLGNDINHDFNDNNLNNNARFFGIALVVLRQIFRRSKLFLHKN
ncbi:MAG: hypothetical protein AABX04_06915 [Nanoarchaeota archaeon]